MRMMRKGTFYDMYVLHLDATLEADVAKGRRDWAFSERDKVVLERESIRTLCDKLRRERDRYFMIIHLMQCAPDA